MKFSEWLKTEDIQNAPTAPVGGGMNSGGNPGQKTPTVTNQTQTSQTAPLNPNTLKNIQKLVMQLNQVQTGQMQINNPALQMQLKNPLLQNNKTGPQTGLQTGPGPQTGLQMA